MIALDELVLRPMAEGDRDKVLAWRNADHVRRFMYTDHIISQAEHCEWFKRVTADPSCEYLIAAFRDMPVGVVNITQINKRHGTCFWGFYIGPRDRPRGVGILMEFHAIDLMVDHHGIRKISCEVIASNASVTKMHKRFGFEQEGLLRRHIEKDGRFEDVVRLALLTEKWPAHRARILERLLP